MHSFQKISLSLLLLTFSCFGMELCRVKDCSDAQLKTIAHQYSLSLDQVKELITKKAKSSVFNIVRVQCYANAKYNISAKVWPEKQTDLIELFNDYSKSLNKFPLRTMIVVPDHESFEEVISLFKNLPHILK